MSTVACVKNIKTLASNFISNCIQVQIEIFLYERVFASFLCVLSPKSRLEAFPSGLTFEYCPGSTLLNFWDMGTPPSFAYVVVLA